MKMEARGVEPLSSSLSTQTSTCLSGEIFEKPTLHRHTAGSRASAKFLHRPARSLRRTISLLSTFGAVAGVQLQTSRSIKPRERDLGDLRLFVLVRFLTRPTNHPRHAACASNNESKPVRPLSDPKNYHLGKPLQIVVVSVVSAARGRMRPGIPPTRRPD